MNYDAIFQKAHDIANQRTQFGQYIDPDDTVCVLCTRNGRIYTGSNRRENVNGQVLNVHAEAEAIRCMQADGESAIAALLLISVLNRTPLLPCEHCMRWIMSLNVNNRDCEIMMHDRAVPLFELIGKETLEKMQTSFSNSIPAEQTGASNGSDLIMGRINDLLSGTEDDDEDDEEQPKEKRRFGGLFRKKAAK